MNIDRQYNTMDRRQVGPYGYPSSNYPYNSGSGSGYGQQGGMVPYQHQNHPIGGYGSGSYGSYGQPGYGQPGYGQSNYGPDGYHSGEASGYPMGGTGGGYGAGIPPVPPYGGESQITGGETVFFLPPSFS